MPFPSGTTYPTSMPSLVSDGYASGQPRVFSMRSTAVSSALVATGFLAGLGEGSRGSNAGAGLRLGDIVLHVVSSESSAHGRVTIHSVIASTANQASTVASSGWNAAYDISLNNSTST